MEKRGKNKMKKFVIKYDKWYYYSDEVEGNILVGDIEEASINTEKQIKPALKIPLYLGMKNKEIDFIAN